ncbi:MAG: sigma factor [Streptosporangiales bacterium]
MLAGTGDPQQAEELAAEAFARAWASWRKVSRHPAPRAWVVRTALNTGKSRWRGAAGNSRSVTTTRPCPPAGAGVDAALLAALTLIDKMPTPALAPRPPRRRPGAAPCSDGIRPGLPARAASANGAAGPVAELVPGG